MTQQEYNQQQREMDDFIIRSQLSAERIESFRRRYLHDREKAGALEALFRSANAYLHTTTIGEHPQFGFRMLPFKGPFVDRSNWMDFSTWELALAMERFLLNRFEEKLQELPLSTSRQPRDWSSLDTMLDKVDELSGQLQQSGIHPSLVVASAPQRQLLSESYRSDRITPEWNLNEFLRRPWIAGVYENMPILTLREATSPALYVLDLASFAQLTQFGEVILELQPIDASRAAQLLDVDKVPIEIPHSLTDTREERIRQLTLRVDMSLYESFELTLSNRSVGLRLPANEPRHPPS